MSFQHLSANERAVLAHLHGEGESQREIARQLGRSSSTISRELRRGRPTERCGYLAERAQDLAVDRRSSANGLRARMRCKEILRHVLAGLRQRWSPELIVGRLKRLGSKLQVCAMTLYRFLKRDREEGGKLKLPLTVNPVPNHHADVNAHSTGTWLRVWTSLLQHAGFTTP